MRVYTIKGTYALHEPSFCGAHQCVATLTDCYLKPPKREMTRTLSADNDKTPGILVLMIILFDIRWYL